MKKTILAIFLLSALTLAEQGSGKMQRGMGKGNQKSFEARKAKILAQMEENYTSRVTCVKASKNREDMKQCKKQEKEKMKQQREKMKQQREKSRSQRMGNK